MCTLSYQAIRSDNISVVTSQTTTVGNDVDDHASVLTRSTIASV